MAAVPAQGRCRAASALRAETEPGCRRVPSASGARTAAREAQASGARPPDAEALRGRCPVWLSQWGLHRPLRRGTHLMCASWGKLGDLLPRGGWVTAIEIKSLFSWLSRYRQHPSPPPLPQSRAPQPELFTCFGVKTTGKLQVDQRSRKCFSKMSQVAAETSVQLGTEQRVTPASLETGTQQTVPSLALTL